jgi:hypothetical protein
MRSDLITTVVLGWLNVLISRFLVAETLIFIFYPYQTRGFHHSWAVALLVQISTTIVGFQTSHRLPNG